MSAIRWLSGGTWTSWTLEGLVVDNGDLILDPTGVGLRHGTAVIRAGEPDPAQIDEVTADRWRRIQVRLTAPLPEGTWVRVWTRIGGQSVAPPDPRVDDADTAPVPTPVARWRAGPVNGLDLRVLCAGSGPLWLAVELGGTPSASPSIADVQVRTGEDGPVMDLPVAYRQIDPAADTWASSAGTDQGDGLLGRYLGMLGSVLDTTSSILDELPTMLRPDVAPDRVDAPWLTHLATWVGLDPTLLPTGLADRRETVRTAVTRSGKRGTKAGLIDQVHRLTGVEVKVEEPLANTVVWRLDGGPWTGTLGVSTGLLDVDPGPPVADRHGRLDAVRLPPTAGIHARVAHRICVHVPESSADLLDSVNTVVQRERPAHVWARTVVVKPNRHLPTVVGDPLPERPPGLPDDYSIRSDGAPIGRPMTRLPDLQDPIPVQMTTEGDLI